jgi:hypothetical protein
MIDANLAKVGTAIAEKSHLRSIGAPRWSGCLMRQDITANRGYWREFIAPSSLDGLASDAGWAIVTTHSLALYGEGVAVMGDSSACPCGRCRASFALIAPKLRFYEAKHRVAGSESGLFGSERG